MSNAQPGTVFWIDHYTIPTNDIAASIAFHERAIGAKPHPAEITPARGAFQQFAAVHQGLFYCQEQLPPAEAPGRGLARYGLYIRPEDIDEHRRRLDACGAVHAAPVVTSAFGDDGTSIAWADNAGNQFEFWAPRTLPAGALDGAGPAGVGRISHGAFASRDLDRTREFFGRFCSLEPLKSADVASDTLVFPLAAGGKLIFELREDMSPRASGRGVFTDLHTAVVVRDADYWPNYERMWASLQEWTYDDQTRRFVGDGATLPARTLMHGSPKGRRFKAEFGRGDDWVDPDGNLFHFVGAKPRGEGMTSYHAFYLNDYLDEYLTRHAEKSE